MAVKLFDNHTPDCSYCAHMSRKEGEMICLRRRSPAVKACSAFSYDPLRRVPRQEPRLPVYRPEDFSLDSDGAGGEDDWQ